MLLGREDVLPQVVLLHIDLYQLLREIDPSIASIAQEVGFGGKQVRGRIEKRFSSGTIKRSISLQVPAEMIGVVFIFSRSLLQRFKRIFVNTVYCDYSVNAVQLSGREAKRGRAQDASKRRFKFFVLGEGLEIHS